MFALTPEGAVDKVRALFRAHFLLTLRFHMTSVLRAASFAAISFSLMVVSVGCGGTPSKVDSGTGGGGGSTSMSCVDSQDCPDQRFFECDTSKSQCVPACRSKDDCTAATRGQYALSECAGALGCQCDEGRCNSALCSADSDCGGTPACRNGQCVTAPGAAEVTKCQLVPDSVVLKVGAAATFSVLTWNANNAPVIIAAGGTWAPASGGPLTGSGTGATATFTAATATPAAAIEAVTVTVGSATCKAKALVLPAATGLGVVAIDELSGRPVAGADVVLSSAAGVILPQGSEASVKTNAQGYATLSRPSEAVSISVFHPDYTYVTIANYEGSSGADKNFVSVYLRHNQTDKYGGYKGTLTNAPTGASSNVHAGIVSTSLGGALTDLSLNQILGESVPTKVEIANYKNDAVPLPAGVYLGFSDNRIKEAIWAQGLAGVCFNADGSPNETKIAAGTCGTRSAWGLTGDVPFAELPIEAVLAGGFNASNIGTLLGRVIPIFKRFNSTVVRDVQFDLKTAPFDGGIYNFSDTSHFTAQNLNFAPGTAGSTAVPLSFAFAAKLPEMPKFASQYADGLLMLGGVNVPGRGVVPLGIGVAVNTAPKDGQTDTQLDLPSPGLVQMRMAPAHHGLEGNDYRLLIAAVSAAAVSDSTAGLGASVLFPRVPGNKLTFDPKGTAPVNFSSLSFPTFPEGAVFNFTSTANGAVPARSFRFRAAPDLSKVQAIRVNFYDGSEHRWVVFLDPAKAAGGFTLPKPPGVLADRLFATGLSSGARSGMQLQFLRLKADPANAASADVSFNNLVEFNSTNVDRLTDLLTAFSFIDYSKPAVSFTTPKVSPATIAKGSKVSVAVRYFKLGTAGDADGQVTLSFSSNGAPVAACPSQTSAAETTAGSGKIEFTLADTCTGTGLTMTATLVTTAIAVPVAPGVATVTQVTIQ